MRLLAPTLFDDRMGYGAGQVRGPGAGQGRGPALRDQVSQAVDTALLVGTGAGVALAALLGVFAARRILRPVTDAREATRLMAAGRYDVPIAMPHEAELAGLIGDVNRLGTALAETESQRVRLLGEVAHEMRTPLTIIDGYVEGMLDGVMPIGDRELGAVSDEVRRLRRLSDDLSALSQASEGRLDLRRQAFDVREVMSAVVERLRPQADDAGIELVVEGNCDSSVERPARVFADPDRVSQVLTNLIGNAMRATGPGGRIAVGCPVVPDEGSVVIEVMDDGVGIAASDLERIFERFYRVGARPSGVGSGLGPTISREIVRAHGGDLTASSPGLGLGATFTLRLPALP